jgi:hypothetical protein
VRPRRVASYTLRPARGRRARLLVDGGDASATAGVCSQRRHRRPGRPARPWRHLGDRSRAGGRAGCIPDAHRAAAHPRRAAASGRDDALWDALVETPLGELLDATFGDDLVRGVALTDALIGTFAARGDAGLRQNRCFLYHVIGGGTGDWDVPVGGMGAVSGALRDAALAAGAELRTHAEVVALGDGEVRFADAAGDGAETSVGAGHVLAGVAPAELDRLRGRRRDAARARGRAAEGQPAARAAAAPARRRRPARAGLRRAPSTSTRPPASSSAPTRRPRPGRSPTCRRARSTATRSATRPSSGPSCARPGAQTLTLFGLHMPARLFAGDERAARDEALAATLRSLDSLLAEPVEDCVLRGRRRRCRAWRCAPRSTSSASCGCPAATSSTATSRGRSPRTRRTSGRWGVETDDPSILLCGAGARRGGGVSGIPGHNAAMAVFGQRLPLACPAMLELRKLLPLLLAALALALVRVRRRQRGRVGLRAGRAGRDPAGRDDPAEEPAGDGEISKNLDEKPAIPQPTGQPPSELESEDVVTGKGATAKEGDNVTVQYVGVNFSNGAEFDASWNRGEPFEFTLGAGQVIPGWDEGVAGMKEGGRRKLVIPPDQATARRARPRRSAPNETLVFVIDLEKVTKGTG